jgi:hypothetical protein
LRLVLRSRRMSSWQSASAQAMCRNARFHNARSIELIPRSRHSKTSLPATSPASLSASLIRPSIAGHFTPWGFYPVCSGLGRFKVVFEISRQITVRRLFEQNG